MDKINFMKNLRVNQKDPIVNAWEKSGKEVDFKTYLLNRNESARKNGFESAYDEYYSNLAKSREGSKEKNDEEK